VTSSPSVTSLTRTPPHHSLTHSELEPALLCYCEPTDSGREDRQPRPRISRTPSNVSLRREFSLTSYESETFDPEEVYEHLRGEMSVTRIPPKYIYFNKYCQRRGPRRTASGYTQARSANCEYGYGTNIMSTEMWRNGPHHIRVIAWNAFGNAWIIWASKASGKY